MYVEVMNLVAVPFGLKLFSVASISTQDIRAAAAPAPRAQRRTTLDRIATAAMAGLAEPVGLAFSFPAEDVEVGSCESIESTPWQMRVWQT
jgi:hypothetical protein